MALSYDKFGKRAQMNLVGAAASYDHLREGPARNPNMNIADVAQTITSNMSFPGISSDIDIKFKPPQKNNGQFTGNALSTRPAKTPN